MASRLAPPLTAPDADRRDDSPASIDTLKRAFSISPLRRNKRERERERERNSSTNRHLDDHAASSLPRGARDRFLFNEDYRGRLPSSIARFTGYRAPNSKPPYEPIPPFKWLTGIPLKYEVWATGWFGSLVGILLVEAIMMTHTAFRDIYHAPIIIASFGATAVLVYGVMDSPLSQPRNVLGGHFVSALVGVAITRLFVLDGRYVGYLENREFHGTPFINGAVCMSTAIFAMFVTGTVHPPAGATALIAAIEPNVVRLSWRYIPIMIVSSLLMLSWAVIINNVGRRRYPQHWWSPERTFVVDPSTRGSREDEEGPIAAEREVPVIQAENGGRSGSKLEKPVGMAGKREDLGEAVQRAGRFERPPTTASGV